MEARSESSSEGPMTFSAKLWVSSSMLGLGIALLLSQVNMALFFWVSLFAALALNTNWLVWDDK